MQVLQSCMFQVEGSKRSNFLPSKDSLVFSIGRKCRERYMKMILSTVSNF